MSLTRAYKLQQALAEFCNRAPNEDGYVHVTKNFWEVVMATGAFGPF